MTNQRINNTEIWSKRKLLYQTAADLFKWFLFKEANLFYILFYGAVLDIANPIDPIDRCIRILNQVVAMERDEALRRPRWCGRSKSRDLL